jgi:hypothetical protein
MPLGLAPFGGVYRDGCLLANVAVQRRRDAASEAVVYRSRSAATLCYAALTRVLWPRREGSRCRPYRKDGNPDGQHGCNEQPRAKQLPERVAAAGSRCDAQFRQWQSSPIDTPRSADDPDYRTDCGGHYRTNGGAWPWQRRTARRPLSAGARMLRVGRACGDLEGQPNVAVERPRVAASEGSMLHAKRAPPALYGSRSAPTLC